MSCTVTDLRLSYPAPDGTRVGVLDIPTLTIADGERVAITGASGAGKSTLLHCLAGTLRAPTGSIRHVWDGRTTELVGLSERGRDRFRARTLGCVFQGAQLIAGLTVRENVLLAQRVTGRTPTPVWADHLLGALGLADRLHYRPGQLSPGQRLRVACARALVCVPPLLLIDEPTASLDAQSAGQVLAQTLALVASVGATLVVITHDPAVAAQLDRRLPLDAINRARRTPLVAVRPATLPASPAGVPAGDQVPRSPGRCAEGPACTPA